MDFFGIDAELTVSIHAPNEGSDCKIWQKNNMPARYGHVAYCLPVKNIKSLVDYKVFGC